jgi:DNA modification methylase
MEVTELKDGFVINGDFQDPEVVEAVVRYAGPLGLIIADPPYGNIVSDYWDRVGSDDKSFAQWMFEWTRLCGRLLSPGGVLYVWGGVGTLKFRPFYRYLADVETETGFQLANHITWGKKRAYGVATNYLFTREELAYLVFGNAKKPRKFNIPLLDQKRGYAGYNARYPAKSEYLRRTNVWTDVTEIFRGKIHPTQKPERVCEIPIEIHTEKDEWVLDPFSGSGTTGRAARKLGRKFVLIERDPDIYRTCLNSLK